MIRLTGVLFLALLMQAGTMAQGSSRTDSLSSMRKAGDSAIAKMDTLPSEFHPTKSPALAMLLSGIVPGAGQAYAASYWKVPVILGFGVYFASEWLSNNRSYRDYKNLYLATPGNSSDITIANQKAFYLKQRIFYGNERDTFAWYFFILYVINLADAYVDASLYDFNVSPDLTLRLVPQTVGPGSAPGLSMRFGF